MDGTERRSGGVFHGVRRIWDSLVILAQNRLQLFSLELQEEKIRLLGLFFWTGISVLCVVLALVSATIAIALLCWETARLAGLAAIAGMYLLVAAAAYWRVKVLLKSAPPPFSSTLNEFKKDREWLQKSE